MGAQKNVAVELFFESTSERRLRELWASLEAIYGDDHESELGVRPHLSLTVFPGGEPEFLKAELQSLASPIRPVLSQTQFGRVVPDLRRGRVPRSFFE